MRKKPADVWVFIEEGRDGSPRELCLRLIPAARQIAGKKHGKVRCITVDRNIKDNNGIGQAAAYAAAISRLTMTELPAVILFAGTLHSGEIAPIVAEMIDAAFFGNCVKVNAYARTGQTVYHQTSFGGAVTVRSVCGSGQPEVAVIRAEALEDQVPEIPVCLLHAAEEQTDEAKRVKLIRMQPVEETAEVKPENADVVIAGGRGAEGERGFALIRALAGELGGAVGASRVAVDKGWISKDHLIGQSGKTVSPRLYINCGISGSVQHITGMRKAGTVISINKDPRALIFNVSDYIVVGDMFEILPPLIREIKKAKQK